MTRVRGHLVLVVGPSGAGKDTLIDHARSRLQSDPGFRFVRRIITRPTSIGEDHEPATAAAFETLAASNAFALHWRAHGLSYRLPIIVNDWIAEGCTVVANGSRAILPEARSRLTMVSSNLPTDQSLYPKFGQFEQCARVRQPSASTDHVA